MKLSNGVKVFLITLICILVFADYQVLGEIKGEYFPSEAEPTLSFTPLLSRLDWPIRPSDGIYRVNYVYGDFDFWLHDAIDIPCKPSTDVYAVESGKVKHENDGDWDELIIIQGENYTIAYVHIDAIVSEDEYVDIEGDNEGRIGKILDASKFGSDVKEFGSHLHFSILNPNNPKQGIMNPLLVLKTPPLYGDPPTIRTIEKDNGEIPLIRFRKDEGEWEYMSFRPQNPYLYPERLGGKVDIVVNAYDIIGAEKEPKKAGVYKIGYKIIDDKTGKILEEKVLIEWNQPLPPKETKKHSMLVDTIYEGLSHHMNKDLPCTTIHDMWYIVTNTKKGAGRIEDIDIGGCWNTEDYPNGKYIVKILVWDARNNDEGYSERSVSIIVENPWYTFANLFDKLETFFTETIPEFFTETIPEFFTETIPEFFKDLLPSKEESIEEKATREVKEDLDMLSNWMNLVSEWQRSFYELSEEEIPEEFLQFEFSYTIRGAKFFHNVKDAKNYMESMDIGNYDTNDALSIVTEFGLEQLGFCIVVVDYYMNIAGDVEEGRYPVVCDEEGTPFWESWHLYEYMQEMYGETQQGPSEGEVLVVESQDLEGTRLRICMRNAGTSDAIITAVYRNRALVAIVSKTLPRNSVTCFELPGTYYPGDEAVLVTQEGTQIKFKVKVRRSILFR